ncbi:nucleotidyltransferase domain-containing protein [Planomonospora parontospora]|uniref:nucleotidyltransferase domain-containing protein n=1 Tax=Planomonospora parontospora TaxID=58119 RepID=UPI00166FFFE5|nr:aminoglycoside nucleotidyltransferase [Planomonospora parontospora]
MAAPEMTAADVGEFLTLMDHLGIGIWLDGGWAVDACLGAQTRRHGDLDIIVQQHDAPAAVAALHDRRYRPVPGDEATAWNFVLGDEAGHLIDIDVVAVDAGGHGIYGPPDNGQCYPAAALAGTGWIGGREVACISPPWLVRLHTGYAVDADDWADVSALCERFDIPVPEDYQRFQQPHRG